MQEMQEMSSTLHPNYSGLPQLTQNSFELLQHSAALFAVSCSLFCLWDSGGAQLERDGAQSRTVLALPSPLPSCEPQPLQTPEQHRCCRGKVVPCSLFYPLETWSWRTKSQKAPVFIKLTAALNLSPAVSNSPFCLGFPVCKSEIMFAFLPGILQGLIS